MLRAAGVLQLPTVSADIFTRAAAIVAKRAAQDGASTDDVEVIVARGAAQAAALREAAS